MAVIPTKALSYIIDHVILPPKLPPTAEDASIAQRHEQHLLRLISTRIKAYRHHRSPILPEVNRAWDVVELMIIRFATLTSTPFLMCDKVVSSLASLVSSAVLLIQIRAQNAALILRRSDHAVIFECFEASPQAGAVISSQGSLTRLFPAHAVSIPSSVFDHVNFQQELAYRLGQLDTEVIQEMMPQGKKAGFTTGEVRDTVHPGLVTELLMSILAPLGTPVKVRQIRKRIRDDVVWHDCLLPFRRSPLWLVTRVAIQTTLAELLPAQYCTTEYKNFMIFLLADIAAMAGIAKLPNDICHVIVTKIARRASRLGLETHEFVRDKALVACRKIKSKQEIEWQAVQKADADRSATIEKRNFEADTLLNLHRSECYLESVLCHNGTESQDQSAFMPYYQDWLRWKRGLPSLGHIGTSEEVLYSLAEFESWIALSLSTWKQQRMENPAQNIPEDCMALANLAVKYYDNASPIYKGASEQMSTLFLVIAEIWVTLDQLACMSLPLLTNFPPTLSPELFNPLLLPKLCHMQRLRDVEFYLEDRRKKAIRKNQSIFSDPGKESFAAQYYDSSTHHQALRKQIEDDATARKALKKTEWQAASTRYQRLKDEAKGKACDTIVDEWGSKDHSADCSKCALNAEADGMTINVYEWPLPSEEIACKTAIVELDCPLELVAWRNLTWMLVDDVGRVDKCRAAEPAARLFSYDALKGYAKAKASRLTLASMTKPFAKAHYRLVKFPVRLDGCYADNALHYRLHDPVSAVWIKDRVELPSLRKKCITLLPEGPYANLQYAVDSVGHSQNQVIAEQATCSRFLTLHEYVSFGTLRADGERLQWHNIKRELSAFNLNINTEAVCTLITQAAWQAGSQPQSVFRDSHLDLSDPAFCDELLTAVVKVFNSFKANWRSDHAILTLIVIVLRILSLSSDLDIIESALGLLHKIRAAVVDWTEILRVMLHEVVDSHRIARIQQRLLKAAMLCKMCYDVDERYIPRMMNTTDDVRIWTLCCMHVKANCPGDGSLLRNDIGRLHIRDRKLSHSFHGTVRRLTLENGSRGLNLAISPVWSSFPSGSSPWICLDCPNDRWLKTKTIASSNQRSQEVLYNCLDGELLVDGNPIGRLPSTYTRSEIYLTVFGSQILNVFVADIPGMAYVSAQEINGYTVYFGMRATNVIIQIKQGSQHLELIPAHTFDDDLPVAFVNNYFHWLDATTQEIEFRPLNMQWQNNPSNWRLQYQPQSRSVLGSLHQKLLDMQTTTYKAVMEVFAVLETIENVHVTLSKDDRLEVALPRYDLRFFLNGKGEFECYELCKIVDPDQSLGTLIGLKSRLVLCSPFELSRKYDRIVLIPDGVISYSQKEFHTEVMITTSGSSVRLFLYQIDKTLGHLRGDTDKLATIYKAYLHAVTSHILPDTLTKRTGTEEALFYLRQESLNFTKPPDSQTVGLLKLIAELTPRRMYYPPHLEIMQTVFWKPEISMLLQHDEFLPLAERITMSGNRYLLFHPGTEEAQSLYLDSRKHLFDRAKIRNSGFRSLEFGGNHHSRHYDQIYQARDVPKGSLRGNQSFEIASLIYEWPSKLEVSASIVNDLTAYGKISGFGSTYQPSMPVGKHLEVDFADSWAPLRGLCTESSQDKHMYRLLFLFPLIAYGRKITSLTTLRTLLAFAFIPELKTIPIPKQYNFCFLQQGRKLQVESLRIAISSRMESFVGPGGGKQNTARRNTERMNYAAECKTQTHAVLKYYQDQWPCSSPARPRQELATHLKCSIANQNISAMFLLWSSNEAYCIYLDQVQPIMDSVFTTSTIKLYRSAVRDSAENTQVITLSDLSVPSLSDLFTGDPPGLPAEPVVFEMHRPLQPTEAIEALRTLIAGICSTDRGSNDQIIRRQYHNDLMASYNAGSRYQERISPTHLPCELEKLVLNRMNCETYSNKLFEQIYNQLCPEDPASVLIRLAGLWPRITIRTLLSLLSTKSPIPLNKSWKTYLLTLGEALTALQRARRLVLAGERHDVSSFCAEAENAGHQGWDVNRWPEWLLVEIEGDFLIRPTQARVALEMIQPASATNSLIQLNMGEGKSSVIVPLVALAIADRTRLSRILVLKSLATQMFETIAQRLGGLVDRQMYFMPFQRKLQVDIQGVRQIQALQQSCLESGGVLLAQPEHVLSFKLMGIERLTSGAHSVAAELLKSQKWLESTARDILDESDELLDVKFQLIYTLGTPRMIDGQPDRWLITQGMFDLVMKHAADLEKENPTDIELRRASCSSFPHIRLLSGPMICSLLSRMEHDILDSQLPGLNFEHFSQQQLASFLRFISDRPVSNGDCEILNSIFIEQESFTQKLLLVRGLLAYEILLFVLCSKRWSVNYGLHQSRCLSAVPYRAKGVPAPSAEFGHPDVAIALTCMSYYYTGLTTVQLKECLEILQKSDDPSLEYDAWIKKCDELPNYLRSWTAVNLEDERQFDNELYPHLRYCKKVADFFMTNVVFPKEGKEFDEKLSSSGWDLVANKGSHLTTGFSGTNDNRFLLPLFISQQDLPELRHTSGKVLNDVLRKENLLYHCAKDTNGRQLTTKGLITFFMQIDRDVRVLIDVGAQVLDMPNLDLIKAWMDITSDVDAGVFFDEDDDVMVLTRDLKLEKFSVSSFQNRMDRCVVYLDEVHTRGTDLKLPMTARAAVTLGPRLTKDRLVQACMRLRKLAQGQTLIYLAPPEVHKNIVKLTGKNDADIDGYDVVRWALEQSCLSILRSQPLRVLQGLNHNRRQKAMENFLQCCPDLDEIAQRIDISSEMVVALREREEQRLNDLYAPFSLRVNKNPDLIKSSQDSSDHIVRRLLDMWEGLDHGASEGATMHEEHEREVAHEVEQETQVERPPRVEPCKRAVDPHLRAFVSTGLLANFCQFPMAHDRVVKVWTSAKLPGTTKSWPHIRVTSDFANTVERPQTGFYDNYLRPINWVLTSKKEEKAINLLVISPFEANELLRDIRCPSSGVKLHVYEPRVTKSMTSVDCILVPDSVSLKQWQLLDSSLKRELNLFAGQLYFNEHEDYVGLCHEMASTPATPVDKYLFFIKSWIAIRRKGQNFLQTHVGQMVSGRSIKQSAFE